MQCRMSYRERERDVFSTNRSLRTAGGKVKPQRGMAWLQSCVLTYVHGLWLSGLTDSICSQVGEKQYLIITQDPPSGLINAHGRIQSWETWTLPDHARVIICGLYSYMLSDLANFELKQLGKACSLSGLSCSHCSHSQTNNWSMQKIQCAAIDIKFCIQLLLLTRETCPVPSFC